VLRLSAQDLDDFKSEGATANTPQRDVPAMMERE
jgi:hypothetical protein